MKKYIDPIGCRLICLAKFAVAGMAALAFRLIAHYANVPNISPLMATELAGSIAYGPVIGGIYGAIGMVLLDAATGAIGPWTIWTSACYFAVGVVGGSILRRRSITQTNFVVVSIVGTLFFDAITGPLLQHVQYGVSWQAATIGQIPFTAMHLVGNCFFALFAPLFYWRVIGNPTPEMAFIFRRSPLMRARMSLYGLMYSMTSSHS